MKTILVVNPGSTGTKVALYHATSGHEVQEMVYQNLPFHNAKTTPHSFQEEQIIRSQAVQRFLSQQATLPLDAVAARGGLTKPLEAGSYRIDEELIHDLSHGRFGVHASNFAAPIAMEIASSQEIPALIADPVGVDEFIPLARYSGHPELPRRSQLHALNIRAVARRAANEMGGEMEDFHFVIAHLGGGISVVPMSHGRIIDTSHAMDGGPFSPQRCGALPMTLLVEMCFSGRWKDSKEALEELTRHGGLQAYLGTDDGKEVERRALAQEHPWEETYQAMAYQISKEIGAMAAALPHRPHAILLTGGLPHPPLSDWITQQLDWMAPVRIYAGEKEMEALALAAARHLYDQEPLKDYAKSAHSVQA